jgi:hypothetical protein
MSLTTATLVGGLFIIYKVRIHCHEFRVHFSLTVQLTSQAHAIEGGGANPPPGLNKKTQDFVDTMIANILLDLPFSQYQPLKLDDD